MHILLNSHFLKELLLNNMKALFNTSAIKTHDDESLFIEEQSKFSIEIGLCGSAYRKIFFAFVLLYTLATSKEPVKVYLFEEPETLLYPAILQHLIILFLKDAKMLNIQVIFTSNSHKVQNLFKPEARLYFFTCFNIL